MNHQVDDGNETTLSLFPLPPIIKYRLRGRGGWDGSDLLQRVQRLFTLPPSRPVFLPEIELINTPGQIAQMKP